MKTINYSIEEYNQAGEYQSTHYIKDENKLKLWILDNKMNRAHYNENGILVGLDWSIDEEYLEDIQDRKTFLERKIVSKFPLLVSDTAVYYAIRPFSFADEVFFN